MCISCYQLSQVFNRAIKKAQEIEDFSFESRLKEKREYFLREVYDKDHNEAFNLLLKLTDDEISSDSDILDGKKWEEYFADSFQKRNPSLLPSISPTVNNIDNINKILNEAFAESKDAYNKTSSESLKSSEPVVTTQESLPFDPQIEPFHGRELSSEDAPLTSYCSHSWFNYEGAGTLPSETLCRHCGLPKPASK